MRKTRPPYPEEFRRQMVALVHGAHAGGVGRSRPMPCATARSTTESKRSTRTRTARTGHRASMRSLRSAESGFLASAVACLMRETGLRGVSRCKAPPCPGGKKETPPAPDLVERDCSAEGPDQLWVVDITHIATGDGFLYLAVVLDAWSRRVVGWAMAIHLRPELVLDAREWRFRTPGRGKVSGVSVPRGGRPAPRHTALAYLSPIEFERRQQEQAA